MCVFIHVCPSPHPLVHLDCWPFYRCLSVLQGLIKVEGLIRGCLKAPLSSAPPLLCVSMASNWAGCQMKGLSVTQVDISGAWESACDCKSTLRCLHINTDMSNVSLLHTLVITVTHTLWAVFRSPAENRGKKRGNRKGRKLGEAERRPSLAHWVGVIGWTRAEPEGLYPGRGEGGDRSDGLLEVTGHLASPLFFFSQAEITPRVSLVPVTVKSPGAPNDFSSLL